MSQISKCPKVTVVLTYWEASGDVSELRYKSLLSFSSKRSYCTRKKEHASRKSSIHSSSPNIPKLIYFPFIHYFIYNQAPSMTCWARGSAYSVKLEYSVVKLKPNKLPSPYCQVALFLISVTNK